MRELIYSGLLQGLLKLWEVIKDPRVWIPIIFLLVLAYIIHKVKK